MARQVTYLVNEVFYTVQGEGYWTGRPAVFCRFSRCNLWSGREEDRATAICKFCDTNFLAGTRIEEDDLVRQIESLYPNDTNPFVVFTGGEPAIQLRSTLVEKLRDRNFYVAVETNGTLHLPPVDWVCVSPKTGTKLPDPLVADEIKLVFPQPDLMPYKLEERELNAKHFWLSPMDGPDLVENTHKAIDYVMSHPMWRLNIQTHKVIGVR
jgi:7-carboxy-7-deazaguanine synthase